jgi:aryl-alcohol dehydrogenase-like predicted oxidoreductase
MTKLINRKEFIVKSLTGIAGISLISKQSDSPGKSMVNYRKLGNTGISVSPLCFGAPRTNDESLIKYAVDKGITFIDTGRTYGNGNNEKLVGRAVSATRKNVVIQSKIRLEKEEVPSGAKSKKGADEIRQTLSAKFEASLKALNTSFIDIMLIHDGLDENLLFHPETMKFFEEKKKSGLIRACGFSTHNDCMNLISRNNSEGIYDVIMVPFNHKGAFTHSLTGNYSEWDQEKLISLLTAASDKGKGVIAMKTCSGGPYSPSPGITPDFPQAVKWVLSHKFISAAAIAMASFEQVDDHLPLLT